ncbi:JmjC domain-containing protein [Chryseobacterium balustinum]|uniref:JmjC domain-containing protein n=1 Tax=Chryseobacterium balustinum TaxID=246 RepID=UPI003CE910A5
MNKNISLEYLLTGMEFEMFMQDYYGHKHLYISRSDNRFYKNIFSIEAFDNLINENTFSQKYFKISKLGSVLDKKTYSIYDGANNEFQINIGKALELFGEGYTIVIDDVSRHDRNLLNLEIDLAEKLKFVDNISTNVYLTPKESQAFPMHYDIQDVFILQIYGSKKWKIFPEIENTYPVDFSHEYILDEIKTNNFNGEEIVLQEGDLLYVPRGMAHEVKTNDEESLHLTISIVHYSVFDLLEKSIKLLKNENKDLRKNINNLNDINHCKNLLISSLDNIDIKNVSKELEYKNKYRSLLNFSGALSANITPPQLENQGFLFREGVKIHCTKELETVFEYGVKKNIIEGDFCFLSELAEINNQSINERLNNPELVEELLYYLLFEGFIVKK